MLWMKYISARAAALSAALASSLVGASAFGQGYHDAFDKALGYDNRREEQAAHQAIPAGNEVNNPPTAEPREEALWDAYNAQNPDTFNNNNAGGYNNNYRGTNPNATTQNNGYTQQQQRNRAYSNDQRRAQAMQNYDQNRSANNSNNNSAQQNLGVTWASSNGSLTARRVSHDSDLARAGLEPGDQILSVNGQQVRSQADFQRALSNARNGRQVPIVVNRDGDHEKIYWSPSGQQVGYDQNRQNQQNSQQNQATNRAGQNQNGQNQYGQNQYGNQAAQYQARDRQDDNMAHHGNRDMTVNSRLAQGRDGRGYLGVQLDQRENSAVVRQVHQNSPAERAGLRVGDVITAVNGQRIRSAEDLHDHISQLNAGDQAQLSVERNQNTASRGNQPRSSQYDSSTRRNGQTSDQSRYDNSNDQNRNDQNRADQNQNDSNDRSNTGRQSDSDQNDDRS